MPDEAAGADEPADAETEPEDRPATDAEDQQQPEEREDLALTISRANA